MEKSLQRPSDNRTQWLTKECCLQYLPIKNIWPIATAFLAVLLCLVIQARKTKKAKAPYVGYRRFWEPTFWVRLRFINGAWPIIMDGYTKYKDSKFWIRRNDRDILILSNKYIDELRAIPEERLSGVEADVENLKGPYYLDVILRSDLHTRSLNQKMSPNLSAYVDVIKNELAYAMEMEVPNSNEWTEVPIGDLLLRIIARVSARFIVGSPLCRNEEWLRVSTVVGVNVFTTVLILRRLPLFLRPLRPLILRCLPSWHRLHENLRVARQLILPVLENRASETSAGNELNDESALPLLIWMADNASNDLERDPVNLAHRMIFLGLGSIHTTASQAAHALYDLTAHSELLRPLREELEAVLIADGAWKKSALLKLLKLDSFMSESQRLNPPALTVFHRLALESLTLSDGTYLPRGTFIAVPAASILLDPEVVPNPGIFDAFRNYRKRSMPGENTCHQYAMVDKNHMHFGHGRHACPGRAIAVNELKLILGSFLLNYDLVYPEGKSRPVNKTVDEIVFADPTATLLLRKRKNINLDVPKLA